MVNFNTLKQNEKRLPASSDEVSEVAPRIPKFFKKLLPAFLLLAAFLPADLVAQCSITCKPDSSVSKFLDAVTGIESVSFNDIVEPGSFGCTPTGTPTFTVDIPTVDCSHIPGITITATVSNGLGESKSCSTIVKVVDNSAPIFQSCPADITVDCATGSPNPASSGMATATDNCGGPSPLPYLGGPGASGDGVTYEDVPAAGPSADCRAIIRTWIARYNGETNNTSCVQVVTVKDDLPPMVNWSGSAPSDITIECGTALPTNAYTVSDNCTDVSDIIKTVTDDHSAQNPDTTTCGHTQYTVVRTYEFEDQCGNKTTHTQNITIEDTQSPVLSYAGSSPYKISPPGNSCEVTIPTGVLEMTATDCSYIPSTATGFEVRANNSGMVVKAGQGLDAAGTYAPGVYTVTFIATDICGWTTLDSITLEIEDKVQPDADCEFSTKINPIEISLTGDPTVIPVNKINDGSTDNCTDPNDLVFSLSPNSFGCSEIGDTVLLTMTVMDLNGNSNTCDAWVAYVDDIAPLAYCKPDTISLDLSGNATLAPSDIDAGSYDWCTTPSLSLSNSSFSCTDIGTNAVALYVTDAHSNTAICTTAVVVKDDLAPDAKCIQSRLSISLGSDGMVSLDGAELAHSESGSSAAIVDKVTATAPGMTTRTLNVGQSGELIDVNILVDISHAMMDDLSATLTSPSGTVVTLFDRPGYPSGTLCGDTSSYIWFDDSAPLSSADFDGECVVPDTGAFNAVMPLSAFIGEEINGNWVLRIHDDSIGTSGTLNSWQLDFVYSTQSLLKSLNNGSTDNCGDYTLSASPMMFDCEDIGNNDVSLTVTDASGNFDKCVAPIKIEDNTAPSFTGFHTTAYFDANGTVTIEPEMMLNGSMVLHSGRDGSGSQGYTEYSVTMPNAFTFTFYWLYHIQGRLSSADAFGYTINGVFTQLTNDLDSTYDGTVSVNVSAGDEFAFRVYTSDNYGPRARVLLDLFSLSLYGDFDESFWTLKNVGTNGKGYFFDACGVNNWELSTVGATGPFKPNHTVDCGSSYANPMDIWLKATDPSGNSEVKGPFRVTFKDNQPPYALCDEVDVTLGGGGTVTLLGEDFDQFSFDECDTIASYHISRTGGASFYPSLTFDCDDVSTTPIPIVLRVRDGSGNESFCLTDVTITDLLPPVISCPADVTIDCDDPFGIMPSNTGLATALDNCAGVVTPDWEDISTVPLPTDKIIKDFVGVYHPSNWAFDNGGSSSTVANLSSSPLSIRLLSSNDSGSPCTLAESKFETTITGSGSGTIQFSYSVYNPSGSSDQVGYSVGNAFFPLTGSGTMAVPMQVNAGDKFAFRTKSTTCDGAVVLIITDFEAPARFNNGDCQIITRRWEATDGENTGLCFQKIRVEDNSDPILTGMTPAVGFSITEECSIPVYPPVTASDNCDPDVSIMLDTFDSRVNYNLQTPTWKSGSKPGECGHYDYNIARNWSAVDSCGNSDIETRRIYVKDTEAPSINHPGTVEALSTANQCATNVTVDVTNYITDCVPFQYLDVRHQIVLNQTSFGFVQTGAVAAATLPVGVHDIYFWVNDPCGNGATPSISNTTAPSIGVGTDSIQKITVTVVDKTSPLAKCVPGSLPITLIAPSGTANITPNDVDNNSSDDCGIQTLDVSPSSFDCTSPQSPATIPVTLTVTDAAGNTSSCTTSVVISNTAPPVINCPGDVTVDCAHFDEANPNTSGGSATASSSCGGAPVVTFSDVNSSFTGANCRTIARTWSAVSGGTTTCVQTIVVEDDTPPVIAVMGDITVECDAIPSVINPSVSDNCNMSVGLNFVETYEVGNPGDCTYTMRREWSANDGCGNSDTEVQFIHVEDTSSPVIDIPNDMFMYSTITDGCDTLVDINILNYISDCADDADLDVTLTGPNASGVNIFGTMMPGTYTYTLNVEDPCGNVTPTYTFTVVVKDTQAPQAACDDPITLVLNGSGTGSLTPADIDDGSNDNCEATTPILLTIAPMTFNSAQAGTTVPVTLTVTDGAGLTNTCVTPVSVVDRGTVSVPDLQGQPGSVMAIPVSVTGFEDLCAATFSLHIDNPAAVQVDSVSGLLPFISLTDIVINGNDVTFGWVNSNPAMPQSVTDGTPLFSVYVKLIGADGESSTVTVNGTPTQMIFADCSSGSFNPIGVSGEINILANPSTFELSGTVVTPDNDPVELVDFTLGILPVGTAGTQAAAATNAYSFDVAAGDDRFVRPSKDINDCNIGFAANDLSILKQYVLGDYTKLPTAYHMIAADINADGQVNVIDQLELQVVILNGTSPAFCIGFSNNTSWRFVDAGWTSPTITHPFVPTYPESISYTNIAANMTGNFVGVKIADLDFNADGTSLTGGSGEERSGDFVLEANNEIVVAGDEYRVDITSADFNNIEAYQLTLGFDPQVLELKGVETGVLPEMTVEENFGLYHLDAGLLSTVWYNSTPISVSANDVLFTLVFEGIETGRKLSSLLEVSDELIESGVMNVNQELMGVDLVFNEGVTNVSEFDAKGFALYQNKPNPFASTTVIPFYLDSTSDVKLTITDVTGKIVKVMNGDFGSGDHQFELLANELPSAGVFFYTLETEFGTAVKRMILQY